MVKCFIILHLYPAVRQKLTLPSGTCDTTTYHSLSTIPHSQLTSKFHLHILPTCALMSCSFIVALCSYPCVLHCLRSTLLCCDPRIRMLTEDHSTAARIARRHYVWGVHGAGCMAYSRCLAFGWRSLRGTSRFMATLVGGAVRRVELLRWDLNTSWRQLRCC